MDFCQILISLVITVFGAFLGFSIGVIHQRDQEEKRFQETRKDILKALLASLEGNQKYINQIKTLHFPSRRLPSFPLDTVALAHVALNARRYLTEGTDWAERYNGLRFELDHINRKAMMFHILSTSHHSHHICQNEKASGSDNTSGQKAVCEICQKEFAGLVELIDETQKKLQREIEILQTKVA